MEMTTALLAVSMLGQLGDYWSPTVTLTTTDKYGRPSYVAPVHGTVLPDGRVLFLGGSRLNPASTADGVRFAGIFTPSAIGQPFPAESFVPLDALPLDADPYEDANVYADDTLFCSGQTLLSDGSVFAAGGSRFWWDKNANTFFITGLPSGFVRGAAAWTRTQDFAGPGATGQRWRWYPSATRLADGKVLVANGYDLVQQMDSNFNTVPGTTYPNYGMELFDPATASFSVLSSYAETPTQSFNPDYTHAFQLPAGAVPGFDVMMFGEPGVPVLLSRTGAQRWLVRDANPRPNDTGGSGHGVSTLLLPLRRPGSNWGYSNGSALMAGGAHHSLAEHGASVYDPVADSWLPRIEMWLRRHHPSTVLLPDGKVLVVGGHDDEDPAGTGVQHAQYIDPASGFATDYGVSPMGEPRGYHTVALLLPDGRVLVAGGRDGGTGSPALEKVTLRYYHPPYVFQPRMYIGAVSSAEIRYGQPFYAAWGGGTGAVSEAVLVGLGSMTHSVDMNQRHVQIDVTYQDPANWGQLIAPPDATVAPPGHYILFLLDQNRVPSYGQIVHLQ